MRGLQVQAFSDFEAAFEWLSEGQRTKDNGKEIPIPIKKVPNRGKKLHKTP